MHGVCGTDRCQLRFIGQTLAGWWIWLPPLVPASVGDPIWIADVLRAEGVKLVEYPGWQNRGHGDFKDIRGVMVHHTGSDNASAASIANGRPDLPGPLSQLHIARDGTVTFEATT